MKADYRLNNDRIQIGVASHGAELVSLVRRSDGREYMWSGDAAYWNRVSPVLFPFVGKLVNSGYTYQGKEFSGIPQHGFARDSEFQMVERSEDMIWFELKPDDMWRANYPFEFLLRIGYRIEGSRVHVMWTIRNDSEDTMYFSIGAHPAFLCPAGVNEKDVLEGYQLDFHIPEQDLASGELTSQGTLLPEKRRFSLVDGKLALSSEIFAKDALILDSETIHTVSVIDPVGNEFLKVQFDTPQLGIWSPAGKNAPFVCIEPWFGRCDAAGFSGELSEREYGNSLEPGHSFSKEYVIES